MTSKYPALKIVESAHMFELKKLKMYSWKLKMVYWKLKMVYWKLKMYSWKLKMVILFSYGKVKDKDFLNKDKISSGEGKKRGKRGYGGESLNEGYFCKISIIKQDTNFISQTFGQTNF